MHVGLHYGSPFRPTFALLVEQVPDGGIACGDYALLEDRHMWMTAVRAADNLNQSDTWRCQVYHLEEGMRPIAKLLAGVVSVRKVGKESVQIWPRVVRPGGPGRRRPRTPPSGGGSDDEDDWGPDEEEEGIGSNDELPGDAPDPPPPADAPGDAADADLSEPELEDDADAASRQVAADAAYAALLDETMALFEDEEPGAAATAEPQGDQPAAGSSSGSTGCLSRTDTHTHCIFYLLCLF